MSQRKTERQLNLVICLLATRRFLTAREVRAIVAGYAEAETSAAFKRMFERDKKELRESGIPIEIGSADVWTDEEGYRISRADYELPAIELLPDEAAVLGLAARAWRYAALGDAAANAVMKLRAAGVPVDSDAAPGVTPVLSTDEPAFLPIWQAVRDRRPVRFDYRKPGASVALRHVEPWGIVNVRGHWYMAGYDRDRQARRVFRLSRIAGDVVVLRSEPPIEIPDGVDVRSVVSAQRGEAAWVARLRVRADSGHALRRAALRIVPGEGVNETRWDRVDYPFSDVATLVSDVASFGDRVVVEGPHEAREATQRHLRAVVAREREMGEHVFVSPGEGPTVATVGRGTASTERLRRLLMLVPYALSHDVRVPEVATYFGLSEKQVLKDLSLLWMCGLPGYTPGDLIDVDLDVARSTGEIIISNADTLAQPLRLSADEAASLVVGIGLLGELPGMTDSDALKRAGEKLRVAAEQGRSASEHAAAVDRLAGAVEVRLDLGEEVRELQGRCDEALRSGQRMHLRYLSGYADEVTERDVDPMMLVVQDGHAFLEGWCRLREDVRLFRLDRVLDMTVLPMAAEVPARARHRDLRDGVLQMSEADTLVTLELEARARWVTEEYVCTGIEERQDGRVRTTLRTPAPGWVRRLALRLGPDAWVVAPEEFAEKVRDDARRALEGYA